MKKKQGFTLIELLVVIAIIALLMSILMPALSRVKIQANTVLCQSHLHQWALIWKMFADEKLEIVDEDDASNNYIKKAGSFQNRQGFNRWANIVYEYSRGSMDDEVWLCTVARKTYMEGGRNPNMAWENGSGLRGGYSVNLWCGSNSGDGKLSTGQQEFWGTPYVKGADKVPLFGDAQHSNADPVATDDPLPYESDTWTPSAHEMQRFCIKRHPPYHVFLLYLDFSTKRVTLKELWRQKWHRTYDVFSDLPDWPEWMSDIPNPAF